MSVDFIPTHEIEARAAAFLARHHPSGNIPVPIEEIVEFGLGIDIVPVPSLHQALDIDGFITSDLTEIRVDDFVYQDRPSRYRFTLAHEIAHGELHRELYLASPFSTIEGWKEFVLGLSDSDYDKLEIQANMFASMVLMPADSTRGSFMEHLGRVPSDLRANLPPDQIIEVISRSMSSDFQVSPQAMQIRLQKLNVAM